MNGLSLQRERVHVSARQGMALLFLCVWLSLTLAGCGDQVRLPSAQQLAEFESAEPPRPRADIGPLAAAKLDDGPYRVVAGDVLEVTIPSVLSATSVQASAMPTGNAPRACVCRVANDGTIAMPVAGRIEVAGQSPAEIDTAIAAAYCPQYSVQPPSVYTRVLEFCTRKVSVMGDVAKPGVYSLRNDEMSLVSLLTAAGGIRDNDAALIRINRSASHVGRKTACPGSNSDTRQSLQPDAAVSLVSATDAFAEEVAAYLEMSFTQNDPSSATGQLAISLHGKLVTSEHLDLSNESEMQAFADKLTQKGLEPAEVMTIQRRVCALAEQLADPRSQVRREKQCCNTAEGQGEEGIYPIEGDAALLLAEKRQTPLVSGTLVLPVGCGDIPFEDVALQAGDRVVVERREPPLFTVIGLVEQPGNFPYPRGAQYNLIQAIAFAGGGDRITEPRYATVYRLNDDGEIVSVVLPIAHDSSRGRHTDAMQTKIKPGDVVALEHTPRTRSNVVLNRLFRINLGIYAPIDGWDDD